MTSPAVGKTVTLGGQSFTTAVDPAGRLRLGSTTGPILSPSRPVSGSAITQLAAQGKNPDDFRVSGLWVVPRSEAEQADALLAEHERAFGPPRLLDSHKATETAAVFRGLPGLSRVETEQFGHNSGVYRVNLWVVNPRTGNKSVAIVEHPVTDPKEAKLIVKQLRGEATDRDRETLNRMAAERTVDRE